MQCSVVAFEVTQTNRNNYPTSLPACQSGSCNGSRLREETNGARLQREKASVLGQRHAILQLVK